MKRPASEEDALRRQDITAHMKRLNQRRALIEEMERRGQNVRAQREMLRDMLSELDAIIAKHTSVAEEIIQTTPAPQNRPNGETREPS